jgi:anti-sigma-K factor RskA
MTEHDRFRDDCGAYALGALEEHEAEALREHLESCVVCREDVDRLTSTAHLLGLGVTQFRAPPELRARVLDAVAAQAAPPRPIAQRELTRRGLRPWVSSPFGAVAGAALALGIVLGALVIAPGGGSGATTRIVSATVAPAARWHAAHAPVAQLRETGAQGELVISDLPPAPSGRIYEVWIERGGRPRPAQVLFDATSAGTAVVAVPGLTCATAVLVTAERLGGAQAPTMAPLLDAQLG